MAPSLPACISSTFCSHKKVSWFLLAALGPFFLPFFILSVPFLLLFIAPVSVFFFPLLLVYKLQRLLRPKFKRFQRHTDKGVRIEGYPIRRQIEAAERLDAHQQAPSAETKGQEGSNVQSEEFKEGDGVDSWIPPSGVREFEQEKLGRLDEDPAVRDSTAEEKTGEKQEEQGPSVEEGIERKRFYQDGVGSCIPPSTVCDFEQEKLGHLEEDTAAQVGLPEDKTEEKQEEQTLGVEGLQRSEREREFTEGTLEDTGKELLQKDRTEGLLAPSEARGKEYLQSPEREREGTPEDTRRELLQKDRTEDVLAPSEAESEEGLQSPERGRGITEGTQEDVGKELLQKDRLEDLPALSEAQSEEGLQSFERGRGITEGTQEDAGKELLQKDRTEGLLAPSEAQGEERLQSPERERGLTEGTQEDTDEELLQKDSMEDLPVSSRAQGEEGLQTPEKEREFTERTQEDVEKELLQKDRMEGLLAPPEAQAEEVLQTLEREREVTKGTQEDVGKELLQKDRMEDNKQEEKEATQELIDLKEEEEQPSLYVEAPSLHPPEEYRPMIDEGESFDMPYSREHKSVPVKPQGQESVEGHSERPESSHMHQLEEASSELPKFQAEPSVSSDQIAEKPWEEHSEKFVINTPSTHEHVREEPELSSEKDSSFEILDDKGGLDKQEDIKFPAEPFEEGTEEGEPSYSALEGHGQLAREPFIQEAIDDKQPQTGKPAKDLATTSEAEASSEKEEGSSSEATSSAVSLPLAPHEGIEFQDRMQDEEKIMADINAIKKIVGYQGEPHASVHEQISALYLFLGMEPYEWAAEVDNLERAQAEIELLKVVVGVK